MPAFSLSRVPERSMWLSVLFCTVYLSYRYPLQYNSSGTSPTYSDTPLAFQVGKFVAISLACLVSAFYMHRWRLSFRAWTMTLSVVGMSTYALVKAVLAEDRGPLIEAAFWPVAAAVLVISTPRVTSRSLDRYFRFVFCYALVSTFCEIFLFIAFGRLPALAYAGTIFVRFGGFLDDPNGFAAVLFMLGGWAWYTFQGWKRVVVEGILCGCILLTQSLTAILFLSFSGSIIGLFLALKRRNRLIAPAILAMLLLIAVSTFSTAEPLLSTLLEVRGGSVDEHVSQVTAFTGNVGVDWLLGRTSYQHYESWWLSSLSNFGLPWFLMNLAVVLTLSVTTIRRLRKENDRQMKAALAGMAGLSVYFFAGNFNLPYFLIFPVNFLFFFLSYVVYFGRIDHCHGEQIN